MIKNIFIYFLCVIILYSQNTEFTEKKGKFYYKNELFTGTKKEEIFKRRFEDVITVYNKGIVVGRKEIEYEHAAFPGNRLVKSGFISKEYTWDLNTETIILKEYDEGELIAEGNLDYNYERIGIWKWYFGELIIREFDYNSLETRIEIKEKIELIDENGEKVPGLWREKFTGTIVRKRNKVITSQQQFDNGVLYGVKDFYSDGKLKSEMNLTKTFLKNYSGYKKSYYRNGNIKSESQAKYLTRFYGPLESFLGAFANPHGSNRRKAGFYKFLAHSNYKTYYSTGELKSEHNKEHDATVYDIKGNIIPVENFLYAIQYHNTKYYNIELE